MSFKNMKLVISKSKTQDLTKISFYIFVFSFFASSISYFLIKQDSLINFIGKFGLLFFSFLFSTFGLSILTLPIYIYYALSFFNIDKTIDKKLIIPYVLNSLFYLFLCASFLSVIENHFEIQTKTLLFGLGGTIGELIGHFSFFNFGLIGALSIMFLLFMSHGILLELFTLIDFINFLKLSSYQIFKFIEQKIKFRRVILFFMIIFISFKSFSETKDLFQENFPYIRKYLDRDKVETVLVKFNQDNNHNRDYVFLKSGRLHINTNDYSVSLPRVKVYYFFPRIVNFKLDKINNEFYNLQIPSGHIVELQKIHDNSFKITKFGNLDVHEKGVYSTDEGGLKFTGFNGLYLDVNRGTFMGDRKYVNLIKYNSTFYDSNGKSCSVSNGLLFKIDKDDPSGLDYNFRYLTDIKLKAFLISRCSKLNLKSLK